MDERLQFVARRLAVNYKVIRRHREAGQCQTRRSLSTRHRDAVVGA
jgi:hypothetical protein